MAPVAGGPLTRVDPGGLRAHGPSGDRRVRPILSAERGRDGSRLAIGGPPRISRAPGARGEAFPREEADRGRLGPHRESAAGPRPGANRAPDPPEVLGAAKRQHRREEPLEPRSTCPGARPRDPVDRCQGAARAHAARGRRGVGSVSVRRRPPGRHRPLPLPSKSRRSPSPTSGEDSARHRPRLALAYGGRAPCPRAEPLPHARSLRARRGRSLAGEAAEARRLSPPPKDGAPTPGGVGGRRGDPRIGTPRGQRRFGLQRPELGGAGGRRGRPRARRASGPAPPLVVLRVLVARSSLGATNHESRCCRPTARRPVLLWI